MIAPWQLLRDAAVNWWNDRAMSLGASIAYYTIFSLAPMLLAVIAVAGLAFGHEAAQGALFQQMEGLLGPKAAEAIRNMLASARNIGSGIVGTLVGATMFLVLVTGALVEIQDSLNIIFKAKPQARSGLLTFLRTRLMSFALLLALGFLLLVSLVVDAGLAAVGDYLAGAFPGARALLHVVNFLVSLGVTTALFALMYRLLPDVDLAWRDVLVGGCVTALLFAVGKFAIGFYLGKSDLDSTYGAAASVITILLWIYYSAQILLFGAEFTRAWAAAHGRLPAARQEEKREGRRPAPGGAALRRT
jgi:membrane protein